MKLTVKTAYSVTLFLIVQFLVGHNTYAQGGWNIGFIPTDSISESLIGERIKIDFRKDSYEKKRLDDRLKEHEIEESAFWYIRFQDTLELSTSYEHFTVYEVKRIGVDYGYFREQSLIFKELSSGRKFEVWDSEIISFNEKAIYFKLFLGQGETPEEKDLWIDRKFIDGVLYRL